MRIDEFMLARISEDEAYAQKYAWTYLDGDSVTVIPLTNQRALAECAAKRAIVEEWQRMDSLSRDEKAWFESVDLGHLHALDFALAALAGVYSAHPDHDPEWEWR